MDSTLATIMYYLLHILAVFGLVFFLILLVRLTLWCLMCNLKGEKKNQKKNPKNLKRPSKKPKQKLNSLKSAEEGGVAPVGPPTLRRSPNVQRLNRIKPEDDQLFQNGLLTSKNEESESNGSEEEKLPPLPPTLPTDSTTIEIEKETLQKQSELPSESAVYATLAFSNSQGNSISSSKTPKRKAPSPPPQQNRIACICPFCASMNKAKEEAEEERRQEELKTEVQKDAISAKSQEVVVTFELEAEPEKEIFPLTSEKENDVVGENQEKEIGLKEEVPLEGEIVEDVKLPPLPETPQESSASSSPSSPSASTESLHESEQNALNSLDQAIEELDDVVHVLNGVEDQNPENGDNEQENENTEVCSDNANTTVVKVKINAVFEENSVVEDEIEVEDDKEEDDDVQISVAETDKKDDADNEKVAQSTVDLVENEVLQAENVQLSAEPEDPTETFNPSTEKVPENISIETLPKAQPKEMTTKIDLIIEPEIAFIPPKPSEIKKRESLRRRQQLSTQLKSEQNQPISKPRILETVSKTAQPNGELAKNAPSLPYKPIKLARTVSAPVTNDGSEPQCAIYARVIDQIKQRVSLVEASNLPENGEKGPQNEEQIDTTEVRKLIVNGDRGDEKVAETETVYS